VAAKYAVQKCGNKCKIVYCDTGSEHFDNKRFLKDVEKWLDYPIEILKNPKYKDHFDVIEKTKYLVGPAGARCTIELKKKIRFEIQKPTDIHVFGYTLEEKQRAERFEKANPELLTWWPLIEYGITKEDCLGIIWKAGIKIPIMYELGYNHNNCLGCVKGGSGYWNKIRKDFPEIFERMAKIERKLNNTILKDKNGNRLFLDELKPDAGNFTKEPPISCGLGCEIAYMDLTTYDKNFS
jgi:3'-phosphoadenosine 5'-phosphosulfate sulfotransferase (PAPS reductase)/FAD synthetase